MTIMQIQRQYGIGYAAAKRCRDKALKNLQEKKK
jgi:hypothetical protein